jgi:hypothetical protein
MMVQSRRPEPPAGAPVRSRRASVTEEGEARGQAAVSRRVRRTVSRPKTRRGKLKKLVRQLGSRISSVLNGSSDKLGGALRALSMLESGLFAVIAVVAAFQTLQSAGRDFIFAIICSVSTVAGYVGSKRLNRELLML